MKIKFWKKLAGNKKVVGTKYYLFSILHMLMKFQHNLFVNKFSKSGDCFLKTLANPTHHNNYFLLLFFQ